MALALTAHLQATPNREELVGMDDCEELSELHARLAALEAALRAGGELRAEIRREYGGLLPVFLEHLLRDLDAVAAGAQRLTAECGRLVDRLDA